MFGALYTIHMANNTEMGQNSINQIPVKSEHGYSPKYAEHISMLLDRICHVRVLVTNCDKSQIATVEIPALSQFVTVTICDGSKYNFSDLCQ